MISTVTPPSIRRFRLLCAGVLVALLMSVGLFTTPAKAATLDNMIAFDGFHVGAFTSSNGALVYCLEPAVDTPFSDQRSPARVSHLRGYSIRVSDQWGWSGQVATEAASGEVLRQMNWILAEHAPGASPERAVAVQLALWELRRGPGNAAWIDGKYALISGHGGQAYVTAGIELAKQARTHAKGPGHAIPAGGLEVSAGAIHGTGVVAYPEGTTSLSIAGGKFADGSSEVAIDGDAAGVIGWTATLHDPHWTRFHDIEISGLWALAERSWPAEVILHPATIESQQLLGAGVAPVTGSNSGAFEPVSLRGDNRFAPALVTQVPEPIVHRNGGVFSDTVSVFASPDGAPWPSRMGEHLELRAQGTLYGPFATPQPESPVAPMHAPVVLHRTLELDRGPGEYTVRELDRPLETGYYYWVWRIAEEAQSTEVRESALIAEGSVFADSFGVKAESQLVPTELRWVTRLRERTLEPHNLLLEDSVRVSLHGGSWLRTETGDRIPANIRFTVYRTDEEPVIQARPPAGTETLGHVFAEVSELDTWVDAPRFRLPEGTTGWVTVQACLLAEDQPAEVRGYIAEWCDDFGVPEETARILPPEIPEEPTKPETPEIPEMPEVPDVSETPTPPSDPVREPELANTGDSNRPTLMIAGSGVLGLGTLLFGYGFHRRMMSARNSGAHRA